MKKKRLLKCSLAMALVFGSAATLVGCDNDDSNSNEVDKQYNIYQLAVGAGYTGSYEEWLIAINGNKGADGATWLAGVSEPSNDIGKNGDFYFNTVSKKIYNKINGVWSMVSSISDGTGIANITKSSENSIDTYTITYSDGTTYNFSVSNAKDVEFRVSDGNVQWSYKNSNNWVNLVSVDSLKGNAPIIDVIDGAIVWKYDGESEWEELFDLNDIKGEEGTKWYSGEVAPLDETGKNGDFYFDSVNKIVYTKIDGAWERLSVIENGNDGTTWQIGEGVPMSNGKIGDFYFDKVNNDIYLWDEQGWTFQFSLDGNDDYVFTLKNGVYTGTFDSNYEFQMIVLNGMITSFKINGETSTVNYNSYYNIIDNEKIQINARIRGENGYTYLEGLYNLRDDFRLVKDVDGDEMDLLKGVYYNDENSILTLSSEKFAYSYNGNPYVGRWEVIECNQVAGVNNYILLLDGNSEKFVVSLSYVNRNYSLDNIIYDYFSREYDYQGEMINLTKNGSDVFIKYKDDSTVKVDLYELPDLKEYIYIENLEEGISFIFDYFSGMVIEDVMSNHSIIGKVISFEDNESVYSYYFDSVENEWKILEDCLSLSVGENVVNVDLMYGEVSVFSNGVNDDSILFEYNDIVWITDSKGIYDNGSNKLTFYLNNDMELIDVSLKTVEYVDCNDEQSLRTALAEGAEFIRLTNDINVNETIHISSGDHTIDLNGFIIRSNVNYLSNSVIKIEDLDDGVDEDIFVKIKNGYVGNFERTDDVSLYKTDSASGNISRLGISVHGGYNTFVSIDGVHVSGYETGFITNGLPVFVGATIEVKDSFIYSSMSDPRDGAGVYLAGYAFYNFLNTKIEGSTGLYAKSGEISLIDCEVTATGEKIDPVYGGNGYWPTGSSLVLDSAFGYVKPLNVLVDGGVYTSANSYSIEEITTKPNGEVVEDYVTITIENDPVLDNDIIILE